MSDPEAKGPIPGCRSLVNRAIDRAILNYKETNARTNAWFYGYLTEPDTESFLEHLLSYITAIIDNAARLPFPFVDAYPDIEASYVPYLQSFVDPLLSIAYAYVRPRLSRFGREEYLFRVKTRLAARIEHWKAEALHQIGELESVDSLPSLQSEQPKEAQPGPDVAAIPLAARNLSFLTETAEVSLRGLAKELGTLDHGDVSKHCHGLRKPRDYTLAKYAKVFSRRLGEKITAYDLRSVDLRKRYSNQ
jgi:hypothetical protein